MSVTIDLPPEIEAGLAARAEEQGISLAEYVRHLIGEVPAIPGKSLTPAERADLWRRTSGGLRDTPLLSDEAISRETVYAERG